MPNRAEEEQENTGCLLVGVGIVIGFLIGHTIGEDDQRDETRRWAQERCPQIVDMLDELEPTPDGEGPSR